MDASARNVNGLFRIIFNKRRINKLARASGFVQRESELDGYNFVVAMTLGSLSSANKSLSSLIGSISDVVTRSALHQRIDESAALLMKRVLEYGIKQISSKRCSLSPGVFRRFNRILVWDSSSWGLHESLRKVFKGKGGSASRAAVMLQYAYDVKSSVLEYFDIASGSLNDQSYQEQIAATVQRRDLILMDRGYFSAKLFKAIGKKSAYYISRLKVGPFLYLRSGEDYNKLDILRLLQRNKDKTLLEFETFLGRGSEKLSCRIVCVRLADAKANGKIRKLKKEARSRGKQLSKARRIFARWTIFITNVPREKLSAMEIAKMYRVRWDVELVFRQLKSTFGINKISHKNECRLRCEIYATLIMAALVQYTHGITQQYAWRVWKKEISLEKLFKHVKQNAQLLLRAVTWERKHLAKRISEFYDPISIRCIKQHQHSRQTTFEKLLKFTKKTKSFLINERKLTQYACA